MRKNENICDCNPINEEIVRDTIKKLPEEELFKELANFYKLLGDVTRAKILFAIDTNEMCVNDISNVVQMSKSSVSHQLSDLKRAGIVKSRKDGKEVYYSLDDDHVKGLFELGIEHIDHKRNER